MNLQPSLFDEAPEPIQAPAEGFSKRVAELWESMPPEEIPHLLNQSDRIEGRRKIADMICRNRPDLAERTETALAAMEAGL